MIMTAIVMAYLCVNINSPGQCITFIMTATNCAALIQQKRDGILKIYTIKCIPVSDPDRDKKGQ